MGRAFEFFRCRLEVFGTGSLDRMGFSPSLRSVKTGILTHGPTQSGTQE